MRQRQDLNGMWDFQIDKKDVGEKNAWYESRLEDSIQIEVPHIWQREEDYVEYCGAAWYEKQFPLEEIPSNNRAFLYFGAVDFHARVWLNGEYIGEHEGGFTPFELEVTEKLNHDENILSVRVYDPSDNAEIPIGKQGSWYTRVSGIWQEVYLEFRSDSFIDYVHVIPDVDDGRADVTISVAGDLNDLEAEIIVSEHQNNNRVFANYFGSLNTDKTNQFDLPIKDVQLWTPENPYLYDIKVNLKKDDVVVDSYETYFGMRKVEYSHDQILLNGKPLYIRGALDQAFYPDTIYTAPNDEWIQNEIKLAKSMGFNMLRKHIKVEIPRYLYWADRMGMLIWAEPPNVVKWSNQSNRRFYNELVGMINRDYNHPSIIIWSLYNEEWGLEWDLANDVEKQKYIIEMYENIRELDSTRLICDNSGWTHVKTDINDYHSYFSLPEQFGEWKQELDDYIINTPEKNYVDGYSPNGEPIIVSEFGVWGLPSIKKLVDYYGGTPSWFANLGDDTHGEDFKKPLTIFENFERYQLNRIFGDKENLALHSQHRMFRACQSLIEEMRKRPKINGYVVTEFSDIEWETNGWLDYTRDMKAGFEKSSIFNGPLVVMADGVTRNMWSEDKETWDIIISNHNQEELNGTLEWEIPNTEIQGNMKLDEGDSLFVKLPQVIQFTVPAVEKADFYKLVLRIRREGEIIAWNEVEITISPRKTISPVTVFPYDMNDTFVGNLTDNGLKIVNTFYTADIVVTCTLNTEVLDYYRNGGHVLFLAENGDKVEEKGQFTFRELDRGESWNRTSSFNYVDTDYFENLPLNKEMGWEMDGLYPDYVIPFSNYHKLGGTIGRIVYMFGNDSIPDNSEIISGYFQGWAGQAGGSMIVQKSAEGSLTLTTWKLLENYGDHPIATQIVNHLINKTR
ncbi:glycoside hydrolase family 2 [Pradoshia eiseniae]|uniref:Glycoside hydrolase family 2 n=1 Tax=Pradoshia eiseniae TaxID=2064768 RepID=A0A2S7N4Y3_9BACI|nr:sugar-binding domain-containing protein [Pradoshia eiseniae]PQD97086.1 glycoside hydrolase family 2 [Pradoshia eiseniae]